MAFTVNITNASGLQYRGKTAIQTSVVKALKSEKIPSARVDVVFLSDLKMKRLNNKYLQHNYTTDVLTFPLENSPLYGEIYISLAVAKMQAAEYGVTLTNELCRLVVHGTLHLLGYDDSTIEQRKHMTHLENIYIGSL